MRCLPLAYGAPWGTAFPRRSSLASQSRRRRAPPPRSWADLLQLLGRRGQGGDEHAGQGRERAQGRRAQRSRRDAIALGGRTGRRGGSGPGGGKGREGGRRAAFWSRILEMIIPGDPADSPAPASGQRLGLLGVGQGMPPDAVGDEGPPVG